jgi:hypothetical protein
MLRYSLGALLGAVLVASVGCAALVNPTPLWSQIVFTATVVWLLGASVAAVVGRPRPFACGFAIFGWGYLLLTSGGWSANTKPHLLTESALTKLEPLVVDPNQAAAALAWTTGTTVNTWGGGNTIWVAPNNLIPATSYVTLTGLPTPASGEASQCLHQIGHALWTILFGAMGGVLGRSAARRTSRTAAATTIAHDVKQPESQSAT